MFAALVCILFQVCYNQAFMIKVEIWQHSNVKSQIYKDYRHYARYNYAQDNALNDTLRIEYARNTSKPHQSK